MCDAGDPNPDASGLKAFMRAGYISDLHFQVNNDLTLFLSSCSMLPKISGPQVYQRLPLTLGTSTMCVSPSEDEDQDVRTLMQIFGHNLPCKLASTLQLANIIEHDTGNT